MYVYITNSSWGHCPRSPPSSPTVSLKIGEIWRPFWFWGLLHGSFSAFLFFSKSGDHFGLGGFGKARSALSIFSPNLATILVLGGSARLVQRFPFFCQNLATILVLAAWVRLV